MSFTWDEIDDEWLGGCHLAIPREHVIDCFDRVERVLGRPWMLDTRNHTIRADGSRGDPVPGVPCALRIVELGNGLRALEQAKDTHEFVERLRAREKNSGAELLALQLVVGESDADIELEPEVAARGGRKRPDFRVTLPGGEPTVIEVTEPLESDAEGRVREALQAVADAVYSLPGPFAVTVDFDDPPGSDLLDRAVQHVAAELRAGGDSASEVPGGGGGVTVNGGERIERPPAPVRMFRKQALIGGDREVEVSIAFQDLRINGILRREADQLPAHTSTLVMIETSRRPVHRATWDDRLRDDLGRYPNVSAVAFFSSGIRGTDTGFRHEHTVRVVPNPKAYRPLDPVIAAALERAQTGPEPARAQSLSEPIQRS